MKDLVLATSFALLAPFGGSLQFADGPFRELSFDAACEAAEASDRIVFIDFFTTWCGPCKKLDATTWKDDAVIKWLEEKTVALKIDAEKQVKLAKRFGVDAYPTMLFVEADGQLMGRIVGYRTPADFLSEASDVMAGISPSDRAREELARDPSNPMLKSDLAQHLIRDDELEEALELLLWCWDFGDAPPHQSFSGVRVSFLLSDIERLSERYDPARVALIERRDAARKVVTSRSPRRRATKDFIRLNDALGENAKTLAVYDQLLSRSRKPDQGASNDEVAVAALAQLFDAVVPMLIEAGRYQEVADGFGDPAAWLAREIQFFEPTAAYLEKEHPEAVEIMRDRIVEDASQLYLALLGTTTSDHTAFALAQGLTEFAPDVKTWRRLIERAESIERDDVAKELRERAAEVLPEAESRKLAPKKG
ncbi:MAG: protein disulfide isomerase family protein [Planctomycetota bacterium]